MMGKEEMERRLNTGFVSRETFKSLMKAEAKVNLKQAVTISKYNPYTKKTEAKRVLNIPASFDIETTQMHETEVSYMYIWMLNINGYSTYGRKWDEFTDMMAFLENLYGMKYGVTMYIYVHNLSFEMSFMMPRYSGILNHYFAVGKREPVKAQLSNIEFKDSFILSGMGLKKTAEDLTMFNIKKMIGDLDYSKIRNSMTALSAKEMGYCLHDVTALTAYIYEQISQNGDDITKVPMTNTGKVRQYAREKCLYTITKKGKRVRNKKYCQLIKSLVMTPELYTMAKQCFTGGYTHAGHMHAGKVCRHIHSMDFTSSYPAVLCSEKFPMSTPEEYHYKTWDEYFKDIKSGYGVMMIIELEEISDDKFPYEHYISLSKCISVGDRGKVNHDESETITDNGRIVKSDRIRLCVTDVDFEIIRKTYKCEHCRILKAYRYKMDYLPKEFIQCVLDLYADKTTLKDVEGMEAEYQLKKGMLNSLYGMIVTDIVNSDIEWNRQAGWYENKADVYESIEKYNKSSSRFTYYMWGIYVTAYARAQNLWSGIMELKEDYCYSDTDSVKFYNKEKHIDYFERYNKAVTEKINAVCKRYKIDISKACPKTVKGKKKPLGVWDYEGYYDQFKTLGAKRYIIKGVRNPDGALKKESMITIAGVNKTDGNGFIFNGKGDPFEKFSEGMTIDAEHSGKTAVKYKDDPYGGFITDEQGNCEYMYEYGGAYVYETAYEMNISKDYKRYLDTGIFDDVDLGKRIRDKLLLGEYLTQKN